MLSFKITLLLFTVVVAAFGQSEFDATTLLQAQVQQKSAEALDGLKEEHASEYKLAETMACTTEKVDNRPPMPASFVETASVPKASLVVVASTASDIDPPGAGVLRAVMQLMILFLVVDGIRRWNLQKQDALKLNTKKSAPTNEANATAAWVDMVNSASNGDMKGFEKALIAKGQVTRADAWGCTPLHFAAVGGSLAIATELLKHAVDVDALDASEETPLHLAARAGNAPICKLLLAAGAKMDAVNVQGMTPFVVAGHANAEPACRLLADHGAGVAGLADDELPQMVVSQIVRKMFATGL